MGGQIDEGNAEKIPSVRSNPSAPSSRTPVAHPWAGGSMRELPRRKIPAARSSPRLSFTGRPPASQGKIPAATRLSPSHRLRPSQRHVSHQILIKFNYLGLLWKVREGHTLTSHKKPSTVAEIVRSWDSVANAFSSSLSRTQIQVNTTFGAERILWDKVLTENLIA